MTGFERRSNLANTVWPPVFTGDSAVLAAFMSELDATQWLDKTVLEQKQAQQLAVLLHHHSTHSAHFQGRLRRAGLKSKDIADIRKLGRLPAISRRDVQAAGDTFFAKSVPPTHLPIGTIKTSGSTGEPVALRKTAINRLFWSALTVRDHMWNGRDPKGRMTSIRANLPSYVEAKDWGSPMQNLYDTGAAQGIPITTDIAEQLRLIKTFQPQVLIIYPTNLAAFVSIWERDGFRLDCLRHIKTIGETVSAKLRESVRKATGLRIEDNYSSQEAGPIAIQCERNGAYHIQSESLVVEILDDDGRPCKEGEVGRVVITDLHNLASPVIRYDIGDFAEAGAACSCGRGLPTLNRILGRERNLVVLPNGERHWPLVGFHRFDEIAEIRQYQLIQHTLSDIELKIAVNSDLPAAKLDALAKIVQDALGHPFCITVKQSTQRLAPNQNGKFEEFISLVKRMPT
jgi:phenylacetate-CoA ligase